MKSKDLTVELFKGLSVNIDSLPMEARAALKPAYNGAKLKFGVLAIGALASIAAVWVIGLLLNLIVSTLTAAIAVAICAAILVALVVLGPNYYKWLQIQAAKTGVNLAKQYPVQFLQAFVVPYFRDQYESAVTALGEFRGIIRSNREKLERRKATISPQVYEQNKSNLLQLEQQTLAIESQCDRAKEIYQTWKQNLADAELNADLAGSLKGVNDVLKRLAVGGDEMSQQGVTAYDAAMESSAMEFEQLRAQIEQFKKIQNAV